jgi:hypothetical protein
VYTSWGTVQNSGELERKEEILIMTVLPASACQSSVEFVKA